MSLVWTKQLNFFVNSVAISDDGQLAAAGTYYFPYDGTTIPTTEGTFGTYCFDGTGRELWRDEYPGNEGIYSVAVSGDGQFVAGGGLKSGGKRPKDPTTPNLCMVRAFNRAGDRLLDFSGLTSRVNSVSLDETGSVLAAATITGELCIFKRDGNSFTGPQIPVPGGPRLDMVVMHPSGQWLVAAGRSGTVYLVTLAGGAVDKVFKYNSPVQGLRLLACALARNGDRFIAGGQNKVYLFTKDSMMAPDPQPVHQIDTLDGGTQDDIRWMAMSGDGKLAAVVQNLGHDIAGLLLTFSCDGKQLTELRKPQLVRFNPNSTSIDAAGKYITVADGHPVGTPGTFYLVEAATGKVLMQTPTTDMNWPMVISANGMGIIAGSDTGEVFYFDTGSESRTQQLAKATEPVFAQ